MDVVIAGAAGRRELAAEQFFTGILSTALQPGELVVALAIRGHRRAPVRALWNLPAASATLPWLERPPR